MEKREEKMRKLHSPHSIFAIVVAAWLSAAAAVALVGISGVIGADYRSTCGASSSYSHLVVQSAAVAPSVVVGQSPLRDHT